MRALAFLVVVAFSPMAAAASEKEYPTKSGIKSWVDPATPASAQQITTSRGETWELVMSDEFNAANRSFRPGEDHLWTSIEKPDGVNGALEVYSHNMTSTRCDDDDTCYFYIEAVDEVSTLTVYNAYLTPPRYQNVTFYYRAGMVQSWNKFCYQGGLIEVRAQLPGAVSKNSGNPDISLGNSGRVASAIYYPTWPGIWMMGNLGRAIFSASTSRMWPFSYNKCEPDVFDPSNQRISACDDDPGYGLNKNQGRGAPEIDILEGGGVAISSSLQIAPGMPSDFRLFPADAEGADLTNPYCVYKYECKTPGANYIDVPTAYYEKKRGHKSWYQGLRYAANNFCEPSEDEIQDVDTVKASLKAGITDNTCSADTCPASSDANSDLGLIDGVGPDSWGINSNGTCYPIMNSYMGAYLCDPDNTDELCPEPRNSTTPKTNIMDPFGYQMDAISANWPVHLGAYTDYFVYQVEWVTGTNGYVRWMGAGQPLFEVTAEAFSVVPQNSNKTNPQKLMLEEPMSIVMNVALSKSWGATPPNPGSECRGDGANETINQICDDFPMYLKIDYIRLYQDPKGNRGDDDYMQLGCNPTSHPTKQWIEGHLDEYEDSDNPWTEVTGKAFCESDGDCTIGNNGTQKLATGKCVKSRCVCSHPDSWGGPRCTLALAEDSSSPSVSVTQRTYGPPMAISLSVAIVTLLSTVIAVWMSVRTLKKQAEEAILAAERKKLEQLRPAVCALAVACSASTLVTADENASVVDTTYPTRSGIKIWVDPDTPEDRQAYVSSRGRHWDLVMSDEFNTPNRSFRPGDDHIWTSIEKPDGVNGALELYSHNMTSTKCDDDGTCYFFIKSMDEVNKIRVYNMYTHPPGYESAYFFYRSAMVQSWNKFCYQGGMIEARVQLPGAVNPESGNPDLARGKNARVQDGRFYPTWPGIWMMGNLGRAIFSASTNRMWPFSYDKCAPELFEPSYQRISACNDNPGYDLNPNQGRGAPEIDLLEGGGTLVSSSLQIGPGMPDDYRTFAIDYSTGDSYSCVYGANCKTKGANYIDVPTAYYAKRGHKSWYQGLRYGANNYCSSSSDEKQDYSTVAASVKAGITENKCSSTTCPASFDVNGDLSLIDGKGEDHWGINSNGTCYPLWNVYTGAYLCDPDNTYHKCATPRNSSTLQSNAMGTFNYQMDAISANWPVHLGAYTDFVTYQLEWVTGKKGYVRWMLQGSPLFEVPAESIWDVPQNSNKSNPEKIMLEEPMYVILNVALSSSWGATPPNPGKECRGDGSDPVVNKICDSFPMYLKIDYIRLYQDLGDDLEDDNYMQVGCDPGSHPTKKWIEAHIDEYQDDDNYHKEVAGKAFCTVDDDCTIGGGLGKTTLKTGKCVKSRCQCTYASSWGGPRCTTAISSSATGTTRTYTSSSSYGPPMGVSMGVAALVIFSSVVSVVWSARKETNCALELIKQVKTVEGVRPSPREDVHLHHVRRPSDRKSNRRLNDNYSQNFV